MIRVELPWPDKRLSPNARGHWAVKAKAAKRARREAWALALLAAGDWQPRAKGKLSVTIEITPPDRRKRDDDNIISSIKPARDGIADALGVDDNTMRIERIQWSDPAKPGQIAVIIGAKIEGEHD